MTIKILMKRISIFAIQFDTGSFYFHLGLVRIDKAGDMLRFYATT